jgi:hypothetical protein
MSALAAAFLESSHCRPSVYGCGYRHEDKVKRLPGFARRFAILDVVVPGAARHSRDLVPRVRSDRPSSSMEHNSLIKLDECQNGRWTDPRQPIWPCGQHPRGRCLSEHQGGQHGADAERPQQIRDLLPEGPDRPALATIVRREAKFSSWIRRSDFDHKGLVGAPQGALRAVLPMGSSAAVSLRR